MIFSGSHCTLTLIPRTYFSCSHVSIAPGRTARTSLIAVTGITALSRVVISQRERTIALRPVEGGLMAHTLYEDQDLNSATELFDGLADIKTDHEMVQLATQLVQRQAGKYESADIEDRYETRLRAMIDAKLKGEGIDLETEEPIASTSNVIDLMAALKKSLGNSPTEMPAQPKRKKAGDARQTGFKLPIKGGKGDEKRAPPAAAKPSSKRA
jgi:DNA end-binding protein Ku